MTLRALVASLFASLLVVSAIGCRKTLRLREGEPLRILTKTGTFAFFGNTSRVELRSEGQDPWLLELAVITDAGAIPLRFGDTAVRTRGGRKYTLVGHAGETRVQLDIVSDEARGIVLVTPVGDKKNAPIALRLDTVAAKPPFVPTSGIAPRESQGPFALYGTTFAAGFLRCGSRITTERSEAADAGDDAPVHVTLSRADQDGDAGANAGTPCASTERTLFLAAGSPAAPAIANAYRARGVPMFPVHARVRGAGARVQLFALDRSAKPVFRLPWQGARPSADEPLTFEFEAPVLAESWYAATESTETSPTRPYVPGAPGELVLDVSPGGELFVRILDGDTKKKIVTRLIVRGIDGTPDPSFGPDYRASGAGPLLDLRDGELTTPLPQGRYRVRATKGLEWSIDSQDITVSPGETTRVDLELRQVAGDPRSIGCDLHVHARPSFDAPVTMEDRVLSLVAQGVGFAVPTEHNVVGNYAPGLALLDLTGELLTVPGVEVTTYNPRMGHFGVFPYTVGSAVPPYRSGASAVFNFARRGAPNRVLQVNHPRLPNGIGYFQVTNFDPKVGQSPGRARLDFDTLEVYNGYDLFERERVEIVIRDFIALLNRGVHVAATGSSDSHRIQYQWAGYPRTMAQVESRDRANTSDIVASVKNGRSFVTSGPMIDVNVTGKEPGADVSARAGASLAVHLRISAAPWIDVRRVEVLVGGDRVLERPLAERPMTVGREAGLLAEAQARAVRLEEDFTVVMPSRDSWLMVIVRGDRRMDDAITHMPAQPMAFTNPIWLRLKK